MGIGDAGEEIPVLELNDCVIHSAHTGHGDQACGAAVLVLQADKSVAVCWAMDVNRLFAPGGLGWSPHRAWDTPGGQGWRGAVAVSAFI